MSEEVMEPLLPQGIGPSIHLEKAALEETQVILRERTVSAAIGLVLAALVFGCLPESAADLVLLLRRGGVALAALFSLASLACWWRFFLACRRLRATGLYRRPRGLLVRWSWALAGSLVGIAIAGTLCAALGWKLPGWGAGALPGLLVAIWLGRRLNQVPAYEEVQEDQSRRLSLRQDGK